MSTQNLAASHTKNTYAIGDCFDFAQYECQECLEEFNWELCDEYDRHSDRSYPASIIGEKTKCLCYAGASIDITAQAKIVAGYYSGACFDFDCKLSVYDRDGYNVDDYDDTDTVDTDAIIEDNWTGNKGLSKIHAKRIHEAMQQAMRSIKEKERRIVLDRIVEEKSFDQIADELGMTYKAVTSLYYRVLKKLRQHMEGGEKK